MSLPYLVRTLLKSTVMRLMITGGSEALAMIVISLREIKTISLLLLFYPRFFAIAEYDIFPLHHPHHPG